MGKILDKKLHAVSPWMSVMEKTVQLDHRPKPESYHFVHQSEYVGIFAIREDGMIPLVRQYRPCVEAFTLEFPAGTIDGDEAPEEAARRELLEEAGLVSDSWHAFPRQHPDTGRLAFGSYPFFVNNCTPAGNFVPEEGVEVRYVTAKELRNLVHEGEFCHQLHVAIIGLAQVKGLFSLSSL